MIDLDAQGPVYRGHKLARILNEYRDGLWHGQKQGRDLEVTREVPSPVPTKAWARLDVRVFGNRWGLPVSELDRSRDWEDESGRWHFDQPWEEI